MIDRKATDRVELRSSVHAIPHGARVKVRTKPGRQIRLTLAVKPNEPLPDHSGLDAVKAADRKYLTREILAERYGSDPDSVKRIVDFANAHNLTVTRDDRTSAHIGLAGTVADVCAAFGVDLFDYDHPTLGQFHARTGPVLLPAAVAEDITGVFGLNNYRILHRGRPANARLPDMEAARAQRAWFVPSELVPIYDFPQIDTRNQCIGLLEFGGGVDRSDVTTYFSKIGVAAPDIAIIPVDHVSTDPASDPQSTGEVMLDIDVAGAMSGGAKLAVYFSTFDEKGLVDCLAAVINDSVNDPAVLSISWGWPELEPFNNGGVTWSQAAIADCEKSFLAAAHLGITVCVSTGDDGAEAQIRDGRAHVNYPAISPYVLAVGGTTLHVVKDAAGRANKTEIVWNDHSLGGGTGGGVSQVIPVPTWQEGKVVRSINPGNFAGRAIPDVSANADPDTGYLTMANGKMGIVGGTSASAPLWASLITRINAIKKARVGNFNAQLYTTIGPAKALTEIVQGNNDTDGLLNGNYPAGPGWNACTGWGTPGGNALLQAL